MNIGGPNACELCDKQFISRYNVRRHLREVHHQFSGEWNSSPNPKRSSSFECALCKSVLQEFADFEVHLTLQHEITLKKSVLKFPSASDFYTWKHNTEESENVVFIKKTGHKILPGKTIAYYTCNRSGNYIPKPGKRKRELKMQGSCKINGFCPSRIKAMFFEKGNVEVEYCGTHVGHTFDLAHKPLTKTERQDIAGKISNKIPFDEILNEVRSTVNTDSLSRTHLLTKHDLYNIEKEFGLDECVRHSNDAISVDAWVQNQKGENNSVLLYKPQGIDSATATFTKNDFALAIMTEAQKDLLKKFGSDCICIDSTHGMGAYDFEVVTVMVIDDMRQGFPCAFFISNRTDKCAVGEFLLAVREQVGIVNPKAFMSDMAESFYNAWKEVMGPVDKRLFCTWHVDRAWQKNLPKIKDCDKRKEVYKQIRVLLEETDVNTFLAMFPIITNQLCSNPATKEYGEYFKEQYGSNYKSWAYCYRINVGINTNMHLESMHKTIKHFILKGKHVKRLDKAISAIMQLIRQKLFDRLIVIEKGKLTSKIKILRNRHKGSLTMNPDLIVKSETEKNLWNVASSTSTEMYTIRKVKEDCSCRIICNQCATCIHKFTCTCIDACIKWNMCKHVHLLCQKLITEEQAFTSHKDNELGGNVTNEEEKKTILTEISTKTVLPKKIRPSDKLPLRQRFESILEKIDNPEKFKMFEQCLKTAEAKLTAAKQRDIALHVSLKSKTNKIKIDPQRRLFSTKKKKKSKTRSTSRPTRTEAQSIALTALLGSGDDPVPSTSH